MLRRRLDIPQRQREVRVGDAQGRELCLGSECARRKCTIELVTVRFETSKLAKGTPMILLLLLGGALDGRWEGASRTSGSIAFSDRTKVPSDICLNIHLTAMMSAAPVSAAWSAPTYPGVA